MDWTAPYLLVAFASFGAVELWFVTMMIVTGHRYRVVARGFAVAGPVSEPPSFSYEEIGLLADGVRRWVEVALLRLCLSGHVKEDGLIVLVHDPGEPLAEPDRHSAREAILDRLRRGRPVHLMDVLYAGRRRGDSSGARRRLVELGLNDERAARIVRTRDRVVGAYAYLLTLAVMAIAVCLAVAVAGAGATRRTTIEAAVGIVVVFLLAMLVTTLASRLTGGRFTPITPAGRDLLARLGREIPRPADDRLLYRVALRGLATVPEFAQAAERGSPDAGLGLRQRAFSVFANVFSTVAGLVAGGGSGPAR